MRELNWRKCPYSYTETAKLPELKPCGFCGSEGQIIRFKLKGEFRYYCECSKCHAAPYVENGANFETIEEAVKIWNRRTNDE